jgi:hypothetical protein
VKRPPLPSGWGDRCETQTKGGDDLMAKKKAAKKKAKKK